MIDDHYILNSDGSVSVEPDFMKWAKWFETAERHIGNDRLPGGIDVSTVFLGVDHGFGGGVPILFETMIFGGPHDQWQDRYATRDEALAGHAKAVGFAATPDGEQP